MKFLRLQLLFVTSVLALSACGGGGGSGGSGSGNGNVKFLQGSQDGETFTRGFSIATYALGLAEGVHIIAEDAATNIVAKAIDSSQRTVRECRESGSIVITLNDEDESDGLSVNDTVGIVYNNCESPIFDALMNGTQSILITDATDFSFDQPSFSFTIIEMQLSANQLTGSVDIAGGLRVELTSEPDAKRIALADGDSDLRFFLGSTIESVSSITLARQTSASDQRYSLSGGMELDSNGFGGIIPFASRGLVAGAWTSGPDTNGFFQADAAEGGFARLGSSNGSSSSGYYYEDTNGDGAQNSGYGFSWDNYLEGLLFSDITLVDGNPEAEPPQQPPSNGGSNSGRFSIASKSPDADETDVLTSEQIVVEFNRDVQWNQSFSPLQRRNETGQLVAVDTEVTVDGSTLTITPTFAMSHGSQYRVYIGSARDENGDTISFSESEWTFSTVDYTNAIDVGHALNAIRLTASKTTLWGIDQVNRQLTEVDLSSGTKVRDIELIHEPSDLCIDEATNEVFIVNEGTSFITVVDTRLGEITGQIPWSSVGADRDREDRHFHIHCTDTELFVIDAEWDPRLKIIERAEPHNETDFSETVKALGNIALANGGDEFYSWFQFGWGAGLANSKTQRWSRSAGGTEFTMVDETAARNHTEYRRDPLDSPIFLEPNGNRVINKRFVFNARNLEQTITTLGEDEVIYAVDWNSGEMASQSAIYSLTTFRVIDAPPVADADIMIYGADGTLLQIVNRDSAIYVYPQQP